jgi:hypothetical protein
MNFFIIFWPKNFFDFFLIEGYRKDPIFYNDENIYFRGSNNT